ncbi:MAG: TonB-dependent receptor [Halieaceae bacterium]|jgi:iron complex outermembrane recepter protein|nr:TonB-dependent receptor [Halieaceae bacterium]
MGIRNASNFIAPLLSLGVTLGTFSAPTAAQERAIEEIVVSALKGSTGTALSDTAMGINAIEGAYLEEIAATSINAVIERTPGASLFQLSPRATTIQIRGISANRGDALVGYYLDDFAYVSLLGVSTPEIIPFDLERVEVLKGPQGTLYGAGSTGGTVRILSNKANTQDGFSGNIELGAHTISEGSDGHTIAGVLNLPIVPDKFAVRLSAHIRERGGWLDYENGPDDFNELDGENYKVQFGFTPNDRLRIDLGYHKYEIESAPMYSDSDLVFALPDGIDHPATELITGLSVGFVVSGFEDALGPLYPLFEQSIVEQAVQIYTPIVAGLMPPTPYSLSDSRVAPRGTLPFDEGDYELLTTALTYDFDAVQLYITANKIEETSQGLAQISLARDGYQGKDLETSNIEIRLASRNEGPLNWTAGYFYLDHEESYYLGASVPPEIDLTAVGGYITLPIVGDIPVPSFNALTSLLLAENKIESEQQALFGEAHYQFTDDVQLTLGLRYFEDEREAVEISGAADVMEALGLDNPWSEKFDGLTGRVNLKVNWTDDLMSYFSISSAQRSGAINLGSIQAAEFLSRPTGYQAPPFTDEENLIAYEIGAKWFATDSFYIDAAIYYNDWEDIILELTELYIDPQVGIVTAGLVRENAGDAKSYGFEGSVNWVPTDSITVTAGLNLMESEYVNTSAGSSVEDGDAIQSVPDWTGFASIDYVRPVSLFGGSNFVAALFASYTGERFSYGSGGETAKTDGFSRLDARVGLQTESWSLVLHVQNLTDSDDQTFNTTGSLAIEPYDVYMQPRTTELVLKYTF